VTRETDKTKSQGPKEKKRTAKKLSIKDLRPRKEIKGGAEPIAETRLRTK